MATTTPAVESNGGPATAYDAQLWAMADALRGWTDDAKYEHVVLDPILLKYISDAFEERHAAVLPVWGQEACKDGDEYIEEKSFYVPREARRTRMEAGAQQPAVGQSTDKAAA